VKKLNSKLVLVKVDDVKEQDDTGFFIQEEWQSQEPTGVVEAVADDVTFCKVGDRVFFERYTSIPTPDGKDYRLCREDAIFEIYEK
jgi:co-chaperonin GroES (HSP10)